MAEWKFELKRRSQKAREPMQASFFSNASIDDDTHALVREAIQNALDAKVDADSADAVKVRFVLGNHLGDSGVMDRYISDDAWKHFGAGDYESARRPVKEDNCRYLVFEDFMTTGLLGDEQASEAEPKNHFYSFMRAEGLSGKEEGDRGRHGIGKYVFPYISGIRMFIAATVRSDDGRCLIAGQSILKSHVVDDKQYTPDAWWGRFEDEEEDDYFQLPVEDTGLLSQLAQDFRLKRTESASGLSIVMPYVDGGVTPEKISEHVIAEYFLPILKGQLVAEVVEDDVSRVIDAEALCNGLGNILPADKAAKLAPFVDVAIRTLDPALFKLIELDLSGDPGLPRWGKDYLNKELAEIINKELLISGGLVCIRSPLFVQLNSTEEAIRSYMDLYIQKDPKEGVRKPLFVREGITIPEDRVPTLRGYTCIAVIEKGALATLLGDSENPAHTEWEKNSHKFKGKYRWGPTTIDFVRLSFNKLIKLLSQADDEEDRNVLADIFYIDLPDNEEGVPEARWKRRKTKQDETGDPAPIIDIPVTKPRYYRLSKLTGGFRLKGPKIALEKRRKYTVTVAYDFVGASKAIALKKYDKHDFDLGKEEGVNPLEFKNILKHIAQGQKIQFIADNNEFDMEVTGFDQRRDILVDVASEELTDEAI